MHAMCLEAAHRPLLARELPVPVPAADEVLIEVSACAVCRTDLHIVDGELADPKLPLVPGHEIVGRVVELGDEVRHLAIGMLVGVPWLGATCGSCDYHESRDCVCLAEPRDRHLSRSGRAACWRSAGGSRCHR